MLKQPMTYKVNFLNTKSTYSTHCEFSQLPNDKIVSIELCVLNNKRIVLEGFEKYLIISTKYKFLSSTKKDLKGSETNFHLIDSINILGKAKNEVFQISFHRKGKVFQCKNEFSQWRPLVLKPLKASETNFHLKNKGFAKTKSLLKPLLNKKFKIEYSNAKRWSIEYSKAQNIDEKLWRIGDLKDKPRIFVANTKI